MEIFSPIERYFFTKIDHTLENIDINFWTVNASITDSPIRIQLFIMTPQLLCPVSKDIGLGNNFHNYLIF